MPPTDPFVDAYLGLGGNLGDPVASMAEALRRIDDHPDCMVATVSRLYRTPPWGKTDQDWFVNAAAAIRTALSPEALLDLCLDIERAMKRVRNERWGPRTLDIDILAYDAVEMSGPRLELPHPRMIERAFVLMPLADVGPDLAVGGKRVAAWLAGVDRTGIEIVGEGGDWWHK